MPVTLALGTAARIRTRALLRNLQDRLRPEESPQDKRSWARHVKLSQAAVTDVQWWIANAMRFEKRGMPIASLKPTFTCDAFLASDASATGYGGWVMVNTAGCVDVLENVVVENMQRKAGEGVHVSEVVAAAQRGVEVAA